MTSATPITPDLIFETPHGSSHDDPLLVFSRWLEEAKSQVGFLASVMSLATVSERGDPDCRMVLLQAVSAEGLVFFTNLNSAKGKHLNATGKAATCFHWPSGGRQVRLRGTVRIVEDTYADEYFARRPRGSQISARASYQSQVIPSRMALTERMRAVEEQFGDGPIPRPAYWSGVLLAPSEIEFWEDGVDRLHDRMLFTRSTACGGWTASRLSP